MNAKRLHLAAAGWLLVAAVALFVCAPAGAAADDDLLAGGQKVVAEVPAENLKKINEGMVKLTPRLISWISHQSEGIVAEMEAIAKFNAETTKFSVVSYLRYLTLYNHLKVVSSKPIDEFKWIARKAKTFSSIYNSVMQIVFNYLQDVDQTLRQIEDNEPKSKQTDPSADWTRNYEIIRFIALHAPENSELANAAKEMLASSPNGTLDRARSIRYSLKTRAFSR